VRKIAVVFLKRRTIADYHDDVLLISYLLKNILKYLLFSRFLVLLNLLLLMTMHSVAPWRNHDNWSRRRINILSLKGLIY